MSIKEFNARMSIHDMTIIKEGLSRLSAECKNPRDPDYEKLHDILKIHDKIDKAVVDYIEYGKKIKLAEKSSVND